MIINTQTIKKSGGGRGTYQVEAGFLSGYNELIRPSLHTPAGTVTIISNNPADFTKIDYLKFTKGSVSGNVQEGQYINTGIVINSTDKVEAEASVDDVNDNKAIWSARITISGTMQRNFTVFSLSAGTRWDYDSTQYSATQINANQKYKFTIDANKAYLDDTLIKTFNSATFNTGNSALIGASWNSDNTTPGNLLSGKMYDWKCWNSGGTARGLFYTCYHTETGILGMFDAVNNNFHMNAGTGNFAKPTDTSNEINLAEYLASLT